VASPKSKALGTESAPGLGKSVSNWKLSRKYRARKSYALPLESVRVPTTVTQPIPVVIPDTASSLAA